MLILPKSFWLSKLLLNAIIGVAINNGIKVLNPNKTLIATPLNMEIQNIEAWKPSEISTTKMSLNKVGNTC